MADRRKHLRREPAAPQPANGLLAIRAIIASIVLARLGARRYVECRSCQIPKLAFQLGHHLAHLGGLPQQDVHSDVQRSQEFGSVQRAHEGWFQRAEQGGRQSVEAPAVPGLQPLLTAAQRERLITGRADPVLGLPPPAPLDAEARADGVVHAKTEQVLRGRRRCIWPVRGGAQQQTEVGPSRPEFGRGVKERSTRLIEGDGPSRPPVLCSTYRAT